jgi:hypothetical protein
LSAIDVSRIREYYVHGERLNGEVFVSWRGQYRRQGPILWAVTDGNDLCLTRRGHWVWEPQPSSRTEAFIRRCRWTSFEEALAAAEKVTEPHA